METRRLGKTDLQVSVLSIGGLYTSSLAGGESETRRIMERAMELGINALDTAPAYADSEATVGQALKGNDAPLIITTKLGGRPQPFNPQDINALRQSVDESLRLVGRDHVDILMIHEPDRPQQYPWWTSYDPLDGPALELMEELKTAGKIRYQGLAGTTVTEMTSLIGSNRFDAVLTAFNYNALFREAKDTVIAAAKERDMGIVLGSTLGQGFLTRRAEEEVRAKPIWLSEARREQLLAYYKLFNDSGMSAAELCLRFAISNPDISTIPIGCKTIEHLEASVAAVEKGPLPSDVASRLDEIAAMLPHRPYEEPMILPFGKSYQGPGIANMGAAVQVGKLEL
ncbi:MAG: dTDP-4-keto-L-6-deoxy-hexose 2,3-reductase [Verrucomicrobiales bacterium]|nr:dTDP-4-keto-L-6-deoxy-hexose 2,3-reductase [Verrucomicrobiales bacterium]|tara:strand:+ start:4269 stop:5291 length:1023 start_codon:yes stop_codon:yes gene_type:complete